MAFYIKLDNIFYHKNSIAKLSFANQLFPAMVGLAGIGDKQKEGDKITPRGIYPVTKILYRCRKSNLYNYNHHNGGGGKSNQFKLPSSPISPIDKWCDDPNSGYYNMQLREQFFAGSYESLFRGDELYDMVMVLGYNERSSVNDEINPVGSAIFIHLVAVDRRFFRGNATDMNIMTPNILSSGYGRQLLRSTAACIAMSRAHMQILLRAMSFPAFIIIK